jgi:hypothetical protein
MAKQKVSKRAANKYPHNLSKFTIVADINSFMAKGIRYLVYSIPAKDDEGIIINIETGVRYPIELKKYLLYI